jgi:hypothetical protein
MKVSAYYSDGGTVLYVLVSDVDSQSGSVTVSRSDTYSLPTASKIYKNQAEISASDICKYDVISYDASGGVYYVSDGKITGRYEYAYPDDDDPATITIMGTELEVLDKAVSSLTDYDVGDYITVLLTTDNKVAGVLSPTLWRRPISGS